jgi:hypothetical protein
LKAHVAAAIAGLGASIGVAHAASPERAMTPAFDVAVSLTPKAAARLAHPHETLIVTAYVYGDANEKGRRLRLGDDLDQIAFGQEQDVELPTAGVAHVPGVRYDRRRLAYVEGGRLQVLVNVFSGRRSSKDNLLDCGIFQDTVEAAARAPIPIACKLIGER